MVVRWCLVLMFVLTWEKTPSTPVQSSQHCVIDDIPVTPEFSFSQLSGVWYGIARTLSAYGDATYWSFIWNFIQGGDGSPIAVSTGYQPQTAVCTDPVVHLFRPTEVLGVFVFSSTSRGIFKVIHINARTAVFYMCSKPEDDGTCSDSEVMVVFCSRDHSMTLRERQELDQAMNHKCLNSMEVHESPQGLCKIPYIKPSLVSGAMFDRDSDHTVRSVFTSRGNTLTLSCHVPLPQTATQVVWTKVTQFGPIPLTLRNVRVTDDTRMSLLQQSPFDWNLQITDVNLSDEGSYICMNKNVKFVRYIVTVVESLRITDDEESLMSAVGDTVTLRCPVEGNPPPSVIWYLKDQTTHYRERCGGTKLDLVFILDTSTAFGAANIQLAMDFIRYFMVPVNIDNDDVRIGFMNYSDSVNIHFHLSDYRDKTRVYKAMDDIVMSDSAKVNTRDAIHAMRTGMFMPGTGDRSSISNAVILITHGGLDEVRALDEATTAKSEGIHMYVVSSNTSRLSTVQDLASHPVNKNVFTLAQFGQLKELRNTMFESHCPEPGDGGESLTFTDVTKDDSGHYECVANNGITTPVSKTIKLNVKFAPEISVSAVSVWKRLGQAVTMDCFVEGSPTPSEEQLEWRYKGKIIQSDVRHFVLVNEGEHGSVDFSLRIGSLEEEDFGVYTCVARNSLGSAEATIQVSEIQMSDECDLARTRVQENFNIWDFLGEWYRVKALPYFYGNNTYTSETVRYFINRGGYLAITYMGKKKNAERCSEPGMSVLEQDSPGKYHYKDTYTLDIFQFLYTDYTHAVVYVCSGVDESGHCTEENSHIEIQTKNFTTVHDKMADLERIVDDLCFRVEDMVEATYGECKFSEVYLNSIGYGPGGVNQEYLCDVERTRVQADFDINKFVGVWSTVKTTTFRHGDNTPESETLQYFLRADGQLVLADRSFTPQEEQCSEPILIELHEVQPGKYTLQHEGHTGSIQIVYTDYNYTVTMSCSRLAENGLCSAEHINVQMIAKWQPVPESTLKELEDYVSTLCVSVHDMKDNVPGLCDIPLSYLEAAGYLRPESCIVSEMDNQANFNKSQFLGMWNIIETTSSQFGENVYLTAVQNYFLKPDEALATAYRGYLNGSRTCLRPGTVVFEKDADGNFVFQTLTGQGQFKIIYTDYRYAVTYSCRQVGKGGRCIQGLQHASILARDLTVNPDTMRMLETYVKRTCVDPHSLVTVIPELCTIPHTFLESVGYTGPDRCQVANIPLQTDFDLGRFEGKWKTLKTVKYDTNKYISLTHKYFLNADDELVMVFRGFNGTTQRCDAPHHRVLHPHSDTFYHMPDNDTYQIVYTDYDYAIVYLCGKLRTDGHCLKEKTRVSILSRHDTIPADVLSQMKSRISALCVDTSDLVDEEPELCLIPTSYMKTAGYTGPPEDECQVSEIPYQPDLNVTMVSGDWYTVMTTPVDLPARESLGPSYHYFEDWHMITVYRLINQTTGLCQPAEAWYLREATGPGDYYNFAGAQPSVFRILHASPKYMVTYGCQEETSDGECVEGQAQINILAREKVIPPDDLISLKRFVTHACLDSNDLKNNIDLECPVRTSIKEAVTQDVITDDHVEIGCHIDYVPVQANLDIHKFADTVWNTLWRSSSIWGNTSLVPSHRKQIFVVPVDDYDDQLFLLSRSYKFSWGACEPTEVLRLNELTQPGDYTLSFGESSSLNGMFRIMYADDEYAVTYTCYDTMLGKSCPHESLVVEILSTHKEIPDEMLHQLKGYANDVCVDVSAMAQSDPDACSIPDTILNAIHDGQITTDYALPVAGCNGSLIKVDPDFDLTMFLGGWNVIYTSMSEKSQGSSLTLYYQETEGAIVYARKLYNASAGQCKPAESVILLERSLPGDYATLLQDFAVIKKVLHVEDSYAVTYVCLALLEDGTCDRDHLMIHFLSRTDNIPQEDLHRLQQYVEGTCAETEDIVTQTPGLCTIPESVISAIDGGDITSYYSTIECSMDYIVTQDVTIDMVAGFYPKMYISQPAMGVRLEGLMSYITPFGDGNQGTFLRTVYNNSECLLTEAIKWTTTNLPGSFSTEYFGFYTQMKILHLDDTELVLFACNGQNKDGTCKKGHAALQISSKNTEIPPEKLKVLKKYGGKVCHDSNSVTEMKSLCPIAEEVRESARAGEFTQDYVVVSCQIKYIPVQSDFDIDRFAGVWHGIAYAPFEKSFATWTSKVLEFHIENNGHVAYIARFYDNSLHGCRPSAVVYLTKTEVPGVFTTRSEGWIQTLKIIFTDYTNVVMYWCGEEAIDGTCVENKLRVELLSRNLQINPETRHHMEAYIRKGCVHMENIVDYTFEQCTVPHSITEAIIAGEIPNIGYNVVQCINRFIAPQRNFNMERFTGHWYTVYQTHTKFGDLTWDGVIAKYRILEDGTYTMTYTGYDKSTHSCVDPISSELVLRGQAGDFVFVDHGAEVRLKIVYTDYEVAVAYYCFKFQASGHCYKNEQHIEILSRDPVLHEDTYNRLHYYVVNLCVEIKELVPTDANWCELPKVNEAAIQRKICSFNDIVPTPDFSFLQMAGLWYEVARTRFTFNKMESSVVFYNYLTQTSMLEGLYTGSLNGVCQDVVASLTKLHDDTEELESHLLGRLGGQDSQYPWVSFKIIHFDGRYLMYYACYNDHEGGTCPRDKTEVTLFGKVQRLDDEIKSHIPRLMQSVCLKPSDLIESGGTDCTNSLFKTAPQNAMPESLFNVTCSPLADITVDEQIVDTELVGLWKVAAEYGFSTEGLHQFHVTIRQLTNNKFRIEFDDGSKNVTAVIKPRCKDTRGEYLSSLGSTLMGQWSSLKIVHSDKENALLYWCLREKDDGTCHHSAVKVLLLARHLSVGISRKQELLQKINDVCFTVQDTQPETVVYGSIPGAVIASDFVADSLMDYNTPRMVSSFCAVDNIIPHNFNQSLQAGLWYEIARTPDPLLTLKATVGYYLPIGHGHMKMLFSGQTKENGDCKGPVVGDLRPVCPDNIDGNYQGRIVMPNSYLWTTWKILYTDYTQAMVAMSCMDEMENGICSRKGTRVHILSRTHGMHPDVRGKLDLVIEKACMIPSSLEETTHDGTCVGNVEAAVNKLKVELNLPGERDRTHDRTDGV